MPTGLPPAKRLLASLAFNDETHKGKFFKSEKRAAVAFVFYALSFLSLGGN